MELFALGDVHSEERASFPRNGPTGKRVRPQACASQRPGSVRCSALELFLLADGPDCTSELAGHCDESLLRLNVSMPKRIESAMQSPLRSPGDLSYRRTDALRASDELPAHVRRSPVGPSRFHEHPANSAVTRLGDSPTVPGLPARVFARRQPEEASELPCPYRIPYPRPPAPNGGAFEHRCVSRLARPGAVTMIPGCPTSLYS